MPFLLDSDGVERDIDCCGLVDDAVQVAGHGLLVERVDVSGFRRCAGSPDSFGDSVDVVEISPSHKDARAFARKRPRDRCADRSRGPVDDGVLVFQRHDVLSIRRQAA
jgi:hypothetical protein